ncbi:MAG: cyclic nucleotide-binding domain-containing protein [Candidatus Glassbacteria bacterium]
MKRFISGEVIIAEGTVGNSVYIVHSGRVEVFKNSPNGPVQLAKLGPNEVFGEMSLIDERFSRRTASVRAIEDSEIIILDRKGFDGYLQHASPGIFNLIKRLASRLRETNDIISRAGGDLHNLPKTIKLATPTEGTGKLTDDQLAESVDAAVDLNLLPKQFKKDQVLIKEGAEAMSLFLLKSGTVRVFKKVSSGEVALDDLCANEIFGEISMFADGVRFFTVKSIEDGEAVVFSKKQLDEMLRKAPLELFLILECTTQKLKRTSLRFLEKYEECEKLKTELEQTKGRSGELEKEPDSLRKKVAEQAAKIRKLSPPSPESDQSSGS